LDEHATILARLTRTLDPFVSANGLGFVNHARAVVRFKCLDAAPDLVRQTKVGRGARLGHAPVPSLMVEVISGSTRRRDLGPKRDYCLEVGVPEYWIVDADRREVRVVRGGQEGIVLTDQIVWTPAGVTDPLVVSVAAILERNLE